jgi:hypothetical protein
MSVVFLTLKEISCALFDKHPSLRPSPSCSPR